MFVLFRYMCILVCYVYIIIFDKIYTTPNHVIAEGESYIADTFIHSESCFFVKPICSECYKSAK